MVTDKSGFRFDTQNVDIQNIQIGDAKISQKTGLKLAGENNLSTEFIFNRKEFPGVHIAVHILLQLLKTCFLFS